MKGLALTVRGQVQGVGFRPAVWRLARELGLRGDVCNTAAGVRIRLWGEAPEQFARRLRAEAPALARIERIDTEPLDGPGPAHFAITASETARQAERQTPTITPDTAACEACLDEVRDPFDARFRYPFANCTACGPRFSIVTGAPYDRVRTTLREFALCPRCTAEYGDPGDRRFHAQPVACHTCGPRAWIERLGPGSVSHDAFSMLDDVDAVAGMLLKGHIVAIKGVGGFHLACDATRTDVVARLRERKRRPSKPFALMARDVAVIARYCHLAPSEQRLLESEAAPIVLLDARASRPRHGWDCPSDERRGDGSNEALPDAIAPGLRQLGFMLPHTPMHHLLMRRVDRPVVMTSGNISGQPQCIDNDMAREQLTAVADFALMHDRPIANRIDDSVARVDIGQARVMRRARGYAPRSIPLPAGFEPGASVLALGSELKNTFCLATECELVLSQHMGDLGEPRTVDDVRHNLALYEDLYRHTPEIIAVDQHPSYHASDTGRDLARERGLRLIEVQHHHAHVAACMVDNGYRRDGPPVLGIALDGLGYGPDGTLWGGEFLACSYTEFKRLGCFKPVALPGGTAAVREPWRNAYAHLMAELGWPELQMNFAALPLVRKLEAIPRTVLDQMLDAKVNSPLSSSCGRLFDAAAAMSGIAWNTQGYEGEAPTQFEACIDLEAMREPDALAYPFAIPRLAANGLPYIEPLGAWRALLGDLHLQTPVGTIAARFHRGLARAVVSMATQLCGPEPTFTTVALSGGCFQNRTLFELVHAGLHARGFQVLSHRDVPCNDGGVSLGQAAIALARANDPPHSRGR